MIISLQPTFSLENSSNQIEHKLIWLPYKYLTALAPCFSYIIFYTVSSDTSLTGLTVQVAD